MSKKKKRDIDVSMVEDVAADENISILLSALESDRSDVPDEFDYNFFEEEKKEIQDSGYDSGEPQIFGFIGAYAYDLALYIGRKLSLLEKKVLVVDRTTNCEVMRIIRAIDDVDAEGRVVDFCGMDVTRGSICIGIDEMGVPTVNFLDYDIVLIDIGENVSDSHFLMCDRIYCVFNMYRHIAAVLYEAKIALDKEVAFVFRDELPVSSLKARRRLQVERSAKKETNGENFQFHIPFSQDDAVARFMMEEEQIVDDKLAGEALREFVDAVVMEVMGGMSPKEYKKKLSVVKKQRR